MSHFDAAIAFSHSIWRSLPARSRRYALAQITASLAPRPDRTPPPSDGGLVVAGELARASGLGEGARLMLAALSPLGIAHTAIDLGEPTQFARRNIPKLPENRPLVVHVPSPNLPLALLRAPRSMVRNRRVIGYWAWELPTMPPSWRSGLDFVHEIWTPSHFAANALATLAPGKPIRVVPHPLAACPPRPSAMQRANFGLPERIVITLVSFSLASSFARKNPLAAIAAHRTAFGNRADRLLLLKIGHADAYPADMNLIREATRGLVNIRIETRNFSAADRHALTACADIVLSLHRSEGFGLVPAEAMLLGVPVVATNWSATTEFMSEHTAALVAYRLVPARDPRGVFEAPGAEWAEADVEDAAGCLRRLADNPDLRSRLGLAGQSMARARLGDVGLRDALAALK